MGTLTVTLCPDTKVCCAIQTTHSHAHLLIGTHTVEFNQFFYANDTPFEERWLDIVISRKLRFRNLVDLGDDFLNTRLGHEEKDAVESKDSAPS